MWFVSQRIERKHSVTGTVRFLRKGLPHYQAGRSVTDKQHGRSFSLGIFLLWLMFFITLIYLFFFSLFFLIQTMHIVGANNVAEETVRGFVDQELAGAYLGTFPKRSFFVVRPRFLEARLLERYPLFASVSVARAFPDRLDISITERAKIILWCFGGAPQNPEEALSPEHCYLIDENGKANISEQAFLPENRPYVLFVTDMSGEPLALGEQVFDASYGTLVVRLYEQFPQQFVLTLHPTLTTVSRFANEIRVQTSEGWEVYFGTDIPLPISFRTLALLLEKELPETSREKLAYIDLRVENRAYYAFREEYTEQDQKEKDK